MKKKGFTLIELMVAMGVIAILVTMSVVGIQIVQRSLRNTQRRDALNTFNLYLSSYFNDNGRFPLTGEVTYQSDGIYVGGIRSVELSGPTTPGAATDDSTTAFCYLSTDGSTYELGLSLEGNDWGLQLGNSGLDCTTVTSGS